MFGLIDGLVNGCEGVSGSAERAPIVLVSGWSFDSSMWQGLIDGYAARGGDRDAVHCIDWRELGCWLYDGADCPVADACGGNNAFWVGWSLGGALVLEALARKKICPRQTLILSASPRFLEDVTTGWMAMPTKNWQALRRQVGRSPEAALAGFDSWLSLPAGLSRQKDASVLQQGLDWLAAIDRRDWLGSATASRHWVFGTDDPLMPSQPWTEAFTSECQQLASLVGAGHALPWTHEENLMNLLLAFSAHGITDV